MTPEKTSYSTHDNVEKIKIEESMQKARGFETDLEGPTQEELEAIERELGQAEQQQDEDLSSCSCPLDSQKTYYSNDYLTLDTEEGPLTLKMGAWLRVDPIRIHKMIIREKVLTVDEYEDFIPLETKLRRADPEYYKRYVGLKMLIDYPGYETGIMAKIPFETDPIGFYKWWRKGKHEDKVYLNLPNQIKLFQKVYLMDPKVILKKDLQLIK